MSDTPVTLCRCGSLGLHNCTFSTNMGETVRWDVAREALLIQARAEVERLKLSILAHFNEEHLAGDGPEIDRWKREVARLRDKALSEMGVVDVNALRAEALVGVDALHARVKGLEAEVERLSYLNRNIGQDTVHWQDCAEKAEALLRLVLLRLPTCDLRDAIKAALRDTAPEVKP